MDITCYEHTIANTTNPDPGLMYSPVNIFQGLICMFVGFTIYKIYTYEKRNFPNILQVVASTKEQLASTKEQLISTTTKLQTDLTILSTQTNEFKTNSNAQLNKLDRNFIETLNAYDNTLHETQQELDELNNNLKKMDGTISTQNENINLMQESLGTYANINSTQETLDKFNVDLEQMQETLDKFNVDLEQTQETLENHENDIPDIQDALETNKINIRDIKSKLNTQNNDIIDMGNKITQLYELIDKQNLSISLLSNLEIDMPVCIGKICKAKKIYNGSNWIHTYVNIKSIYVSSLVEVINMNDYDNLGSKDENDSIRNSTVPYVISLYGENFKYLKKLKTFINKTSLVQDVLNKYNKQFTLDDIVNLPLETLVYNFAYVYDYTDYNGYGSITTTPIPNKSCSEFIPGSNKKLLDSIDNLPKFTKLNSIHFTNMCFETSRLYKILKTMGFKIIEQIYNPLDINITQSVHAVRK